MQAEILNRSWLVLEYFKWLLENQRDILKRNTDNNNNNNKKSLMKIREETLC